MKSSLIIKKLLASPLYRFKKMGMTLQLKENNDFLILMYHRIIEKRASEAFLQGGMYVDPSTFGRHIRFLKDNFNIISLADVSRIGDLNNNVGNNKSFCVLTFDDGWNDFYENAYPVLKSNNVSATVFLSTDFIGTKEQFWTEKLAYILSEMEKFGKNARNTKKSSNYMVNAIESMQGSIEHRIEKAVEELKILPAEEIDPVLKELAERRRGDPAMQGKSFLSWEEAREMRKSGIVFFGSHTKSHRILNTASEDVIRDELIQSKKKLIEEGVVSPSFIPFAYPNGNYTRRIAEMVEQAGYSLAVTTERGWNRAADGEKELFQLRRIGVHQDIASTDAMLACRIYGIY